MTCAIDRPAAKFTQTVNGFAELGALFDIDPEANYPDAAERMNTEEPDDSHTGGAATLDACLAVADRWADAPEPDPATASPGCPARIAPYGRSRASCPLAKSQRVSAVPGPPSSRGRISSGCTGIARARGSRTSATPSAVWQRYWA